jgi:hypothetical protein
MAASVQQIGQEQRRKISARVACRRYTTLSNTFNAGSIYSFRVKESLRYTVPAFQNALESTSHQTLAHQVRSMNNILKKVLAVFIVAAVAAPAVSYAKPPHHHKYTKAKHVKHVAH